MRPHTVQEQSLDFLTLGNSLYLPSSTAEITSSSRLQTILDPWITGKSGTSSQSTKSTNIDSFIWKRKFQREYKLIRITETLLKYNLTRLELFKEITNLDKVTIETYYLRFHITHIPVCILLSSGIFLRTFAQHQQPT
jgi:hypothetical protein